jgi:GNAT superfamily N-acetyltransferase
VSVEVEQIDPTDDVAFAEWFSVIAASDEHRWPGRPGWQPEEQRARALDHDGPHRVVLLGARLDGRVAGAGSLEAARHDNPHLAEMRVEVTPARRRSGVGRALVKAAEHLAAADGRSVVFVTEEAPHGTDARGAIAFARGLGYEVVLESLRRELSVPIDPARAAELQRQAAPFAAAYEIETLTAWPDHWLEDRAAFGRHMSTDPPLGGLALDEERWTPERVRRHEHLVDRMGRELLVAAAIERSSARPVAFTELTVSRTVPELAYQWDTLVLPEHRGHRLGLLLKLANLAQLSAVAPATRVVVTWNSAANDPMIAVNDALGCRVVSVGRTWQKRL